MADTILTNARVWTGERARPSAEAIAISGDRIAAVGTASEIDRLRTNSTRVIDGGGRRVLPGFIDSHLHIPWGAMQLASVDLKDAASREEFARRIGERAQARPGEWVQGGGWDEQAWTPATLPTRDLIDPLTADTPVFVRRYDVHTALANSVALRLAGITADTPDPVGGTIVRDERGVPTGVLKDAAMQFVQRVIPPPSDAQRVCEIKAALEQIARAGITSVHDMNPSAEDIQLYERLAARGELTVRIYAVPLETEWFERRDDASAPWNLTPEDEASWFVRSHAVKGFADGSLGSSTAYFFEPYSDAPACYGLLSDEMQPIEAVRNRLVAADAAGRQLCMHAIGDRAVSVMLGLYEDVCRANAARDRRLRIEHAQHVAAPDFARFAALGVIASVQPYHLSDDGRWAEKRVGRERLAGTFAFRTFLDRGVKLAFGTDWPVAPLNPLLTLRAAVTRETTDGLRPNGWIPEQKLALTEAVEACTAAGAYAEGAEREKGTLAAGKLADLVLVNEDIFEIEPHHLGGIQVDLTMVGGRIVHER